MSISIKKIITALIYIFIFPYHCQAHHGFSESLFTEKGLDTQIESVREKLENHYYHLVENGHFPSSYNNNLIINTSLKRNLTKEGMVLLALIQWLEKQTDRDSVYLLKKINKLFFLRFHQFVYDMHLKKEDQVAVLYNFQNLYQLKISINSLDTTPFRTMMSKIILLIFITNASEMGYEKRRETMAYVLDKVKKEMLAVNNQLPTDKKVKDEIIKAFVTMLEIYAVKEPLVKTNSLKKFIVITIIVIVIGYLIYKYITNREAIINKINDWVGIARTHVIKPVIKEVVGTATETACDVMGPKIDATMVKLNDHLEKIESKIDKITSGETVENSVVGAAKGVGKVVTSPIWWPAQQIHNLVTGSKDQPNKDNTK